MLMSYFPSHGYQIFYNIILHSLVCWNMIKIGYGSVPGQWLVGHGTEIELDVDVVFFPPSCYLESVITSAKKTFITKNVT